MDQQAFDISSMNLADKEPETVYEEPPKITLAREKVMEEAQKAIDSSAKKAVSLVVIGTLILHGAEAGTHVSNMQGMLTLVNRH